MSITPQVPNYAQSVETAKAFWKTKQGGFSAKVLLGAAVILGLVIFFNLAAIMDFFTNIIWSTINLAIAAAILTVITSPFWCPPVRLFLSNAFQLTMRWSYRKLVQKDPIGIMLNNRDQVRDELGGLEKGVQQLAGSKQGLETDIQTQMDLIRANKAKSDAVDKKIADTQASLPRLTGNSRMQASLDLQQFGYSKQMYEQAAGIAKQTIDHEKTILQQTDTMYDQMCRLRNLADFKVQSLTMQADMYSKQRKVILAGQQGLISAKRIMKGDPHQLDLLDMAIEQINNETADTIGAMKDFNRNMDKYLTDMDIDNAAKGQDGRDVFAELEKKLALPPESIVGVGGAQPTVTDDGVVIKSDNDYMKFLK